MNTATNHFYPFFWQHGEDEETLVHYVEKIYQIGMRAVCVEARPHPDFVGEKWWYDLHVIIRECEKRDMKIWILDDAHFPTGSANGRIQQDYPQFQKQYIAMRRFDVVGPFKHARLDISHLKGRVWEKSWNTQAIVGVYFAQRVSAKNEKNDPIKIETLIDVTDQVKDKTVHLDIPQGDWSVFVVFSTQEGGEEATKYYLNPLVKEATQVLVNEVYEKHWQEVGEYFGSTITAFFSDEPRFGNAKGCDSQIGHLDIVLPWYEGLEKNLAFNKSYLPLLWVPDRHELHRDIRYEYMDTITKLYRDNFVKVLADWCSQHGVEYVGHTIEDNGAHARLGYGTGHFFRGQEAQHMSGIDVIGGQIVPGMPYHHDAFQTGGSNGQFYHYALAKLGASAAHLTIHKNGRAMCEAYGAYGWNEGLKTMKWITDHLIVRGINVIVPHAFSPQTYPDFDCPPHFYAHGYNPQYRYMHKLTTYANRLMRMFSNGQHRAPIAVCYPAECEWAGKSMPIECVMQELTEHQLDMDIVSFDHLKCASVDNGQLCIAQERFKVLVVPYVEYLPKPLIEIFNSLLKEGLRLIFVDKLPVNHRALSGKVDIISLQELAFHLAPLADIQLVKAHTGLVYYHYEKANQHYWLFFNESLSQIVDTKVIFNGATKPLFAYDAYEDTYQKIQNDHLKLEPYQTVVWASDVTKNLAVVPEKMRKRVVIQTNWAVTYASSKAYPIFEPLTQMDRFVPINTLEGCERLVGTVAYETCITFENPAKVVEIEIGTAYEIAEVFVNEQSLGVCIAPPYRFFAQGMFCKGENTLRIEVTNTLGTQHRGGLNQYLLIEPFGLTEQVSLLIAE